jgi:hypothetical protein
MPVGDVCLKTNRMWPRIVRARTTARALLSCLLERAWCADVPQHQSLFNLAAVSCGPEQLYELDEVQNLLAATALTSAAVSATAGAPSTGAVQAELQCGPQLVLAGLSGHQSVDV